MGETTERELRVKIRESQVREQALRVQIEQEKLVRERIMVEFEAVQGRSDSEKCAD